MPKVQKRVDRSADVLDRIGFYNNKFFLNLMDSVTKIEDRQLRVLTAIVLPTIERYHNGLNPFQEGVFLDLMCSEGGMEDVREKTGLHPAIIGKEKERFGTYVAKNTKALESEFDDPVTKAIAVHLGCSTLELQSFFYSAFAPELVKR